MRNIVRYSFIIIFSIAFVLLSINCSALSNPANAYCNEMNKEFGGYSYKIVNTPNGEKGICVMPDKTECEEWNFLEGKCGQAFSYCTKQGYDIKTIKGGGRFSEEYGACIPKTQKQIAALGSGGKSVIDTMNLRQKIIGDFKYKKSTGSFIQSLTGLFIKRLTGLFIQPKVQNLELPSYFDWRNYSDEDWVTSVKNQGSCGSCWAFSVTGVVEAKYNIIKNNSRLDPDLSEQYLVSDCCTDCGDCGGGSTSTAFTYIKNYGISDENCFQYLGTDSSCNRCSDWNSRLWNISDYSSVEATLLLQQ